jgi:hypothetical protein
VEAGLHRPVVSPVGRVGMSVACCHLAGASHTAKSVATATAAISAL